jgi:hypothetical protein
MPSTDNVPAITSTSAETADDEEEEEEDDDDDDDNEMKLDQLLHTGTVNMSGVGKVDDETSTSSADETHEESSTSTEEEEEETDQSNKRDDTDLELDELPVEKGPTSPTSDGNIQVNPTAVELGDRSSPDGFEWPDCPVTPPPLKRSFSPLYRRPPSPYDNVPTPPVVHTSWGLDALRSLESSAVVTTAVIPSSDSNDNNNEQEGEEEEEEEESDESSEGSREQDQEKGKVNI